MHPAFQPSSCLRHCLCCCASLFAGAAGVEAESQVIFVNWDHLWSFIRPLNGVLPPGSGATELNAGPVKWYAAQPEFDSGYLGPAFSLCNHCIDFGPNGDWQFGNGPGPLADNTMTYAIVQAGQTWLPEFTGAGTFLFEPASNARLTAYFRTTFTIPNDGETYIHPIIRYLVDDGGWIYLDGVPVLRINMPPSAQDDFTALAVNTVETESNLRTAHLWIPAGATVGGAIIQGGELHVAGNATLLQTAPQLTPGTHTLAVSVHNASRNSADIALALQVQASKRQLDSDGDGMSDKWELAHQLDPADPTGRDSDPDSDKQTNLQEFLAGTAPQDAASVLAITEIARDSRFGRDLFLTLTWTSVTGKFYTLDYSNDGITWSNDGWETPAAEAPAAVTRLTGIGPIHLGPARRLFRVRVVR